MAASDLFDVPTIVRLQQVVANFRSGGLLLPDFQRPFVWRDEQRIQLFDSILKGLPIGSLLIWVRLSWDDGARKSWNDPQDRLAA